MGLTEVRLHELFRGRPDALYEDGYGCRRGDFDWPQLWHDHVNGAVNMGIYPLVPIGHGSETPVYNWLVRWGCSDFDMGYEGSWPHAVNLYNTFRVLGVQAWIERSRSKGFHVWVFAEDWCRANDMRRMFLYAHQVCGAPTREVNPKATESDDPEFVGNCVRMPFFQAATYASPDRGGQRMLPRWSPAMSWDHTALPLQTWLDIAEETLADPELIASLAERYVEPPRPERIAIEGHSDEAAEELVRKGRSPLLYVMWKDGPLPDADRSSTLVRVAVQSREAGLTPAEAYTVVEAFDAKWTQKYSERRDAERRYTDLIERAWS